MSQSNQILDLVLKIEELKSKKDYFLRIAYLEEADYKKKCYYELAKDVEEMIKDLEKNMMELIY
jgi:hypothetical protein